MAYYSVDDIYAILEELGDDEKSSLYSKLETIEQYDLPTMDLGVLTIPELEFALRAFRHEAAKSDVDYVNAKADYSRLEALKKIKFARIMDTFEGKKTEKENKALLSTEWETFLTELLDAERSMDMARAIRDDKRFAIEVARSVLSSQHKERERCV